MTQDLSTSSLFGAPTITKQRLESIRRNLTVQKVHALTPHMLRITLVGKELEGFRSPSPDDHIKVFFPAADGEEAKRDYTPRHFDAVSNTLIIDFLLHEGGIGSTWARNAKPGTPLQIGGPRGSTAISAPGAWWILIGDAAALPSVGRRLEEVAEGTRVTTVMAVTSTSEEQQFNTKADLSAHWVHRPDAQAADASPFLNALSKLKLPEGPGFVWIGAEEEISRAVRSYFVDRLGHPTEWIKASSYWSMDTGGHR